MLKGLSMKRDYQFEEQKKKYPDFENERLQLEEEKRQVIQAEANVKHLAGQ